MPNSSHFNLLIPRSNVEKLPFFPVGRGFIPKNFGGFKEYIEKHNLKLIGKHSLSKGTTTSSEFIPV
jgi:hypothetical protein